MYIVSQNLKRLFEWISNITNRKWRDRTNGKNVGKIKNFVYGHDLLGIEGERGVHKLMSKGRFPSPILNFEPPLTKYIVYMCPTRNNCIAVKHFQ